MMSENLYQFQSQQSINVDPTALDDMEDYLTYDLKSSDTAFNDLFPEFDLNTNDLQGSDCLRNNINYSQSTANLPASCNASFLSGTTSDNMRNNQPEMNVLLSSNTLKLIIGQQPVINSSSSNPTYHTNHYESTSLQSSNTTNYQPRKQTITKRSRSPPVQLPKESERISLTFDQFQALIRASSNTSGTISTLLENSTIIGNNMPLKIVNQTTSQMNSYESSDELSGEDLSINNNNLKVSNGSNSHSRRKPSQNAIEKRYRSSINEKILELKEIVAVNDEKIQKSGILRRTTEYIQQLQSTNRRLEEENSTLKSILIQLNLTNVDSSNTNDIRSSNKNPTTPSSSLFSNDSNESRLAATDEAYNPVQKRQKRTHSKGDMVNGSRLVLCSFMLCILITNPFNYLLDLIHSSDNDGTMEIQTSISSRTLQTATNNEGLNSSIYLSKSWKQFLAWMLNISICLVCLVKLFVYGEPVVLESDMGEYYVYKKKADQLMNENQFIEARIYYYQCCEKLYAPIDHTYLYYFSSLTWQLTRLCLNLIFLGRWLTYWSAWTKSLDTRNYNCELTDCLLQLWKIEYQYSISFLQIFNLFLLTINSSINSGKKRNEIYLLSALTFQKFNGLFTIFLPYLLKFLQPIDINDEWFMNTDRLNQFIFEKKIYLFKHKIFIESIRIQYFEYILYANIQNQLLFQDEQQQQIMINNMNELDHFLWWQHSLQVIRCISNDKPNINDIESTNLLQQSIYHRARSMEIVDERFIMIIETIHNILLVLTDDNIQTNSSMILLLEQLGQSSRLLTSIIETCFDNLDLAIKTLLFDGILSLRLRLLTSSMTDNKKQTPFLDDFKRELDNYKQLNHLMKLPKQRLYLFESIFRASSGLNPLITQTLFECALKQSNLTIQTNEESSPNLDIIAALLLFCQFLPSTVFRYRNILQQAAAISSKTSKNNNRYRLQQQCLTLIHQPYLTL